MKQIILIVTFIIITISGYSQNIKTEKYEVYLTSIIANEVNIAKSMYMTARKQYFYEGEVEVNIIATNKTEVYLFYFTSWDDSYKEFIVKDRNYNELSPELTFNDKVTAIILKDGKEEKYKLIDNSDVDYSILSSILVWLEHKE